MEGIKVLLKGIASRLPGRNNEATRSKWIERTLREIPGGSRILDAGCGEQQFRKFCSHLVYVGQDFAGYDGKGDERGLQTGSWDQTKLDIVCDIVSVPEPDGSFDAILCTEVLEHVVDPVAVLREFSRLLKPQGFLILTAPFCSLTHFAPYHFSTGFNHYWYSSHLQALGFSVQEIQANGNFFEYLAQEIRRNAFMAKRYTSPSAAALSVVAYYLFGLPFICVLGLLSSGDRGSSEVLCFGYHVLARRLSKPSSPIYHSAREMNPKC
jgi:ubiquinone/menaquinone biosynthesis C-methylase UbiE